MAWLTYIYICMYMCMVVEFIPNLNTAMLDCVRYKARLGMRSSGIAQMFVILLRQEFADPRGGLHKRLD